MMHTERYICVVFTTTRVDSVGAQKPTGARTFVLPLNRMGTCLISLQLTIVIMRSAAKRESNDPVCVCISTIGDINQPHCSLPCSIQNSNHKRR